MDQKNYIKDDEKDPLTKKLVKDGFSFGEFDEETREFLNRRGAEMYLLGARDVSVHAGILYDSEECAGSPSEIIIDISIPDYELGSFKLWDLFNESFPGEDAYEAYPAMLEKMASEFRSVVKKANP